MYKAEMLCLLAKTTAEARLFQSRSAGCKAGCDPLAVDTGQLSSVLQLTFSGNTNSTCRRLLPLWPLDSCLTATLQVQIPKCIHFSLPRSPTTHSPSLYLNFRLLYLYLRTTFTRRTSGEQKENLQTNKCFLSLLFVTELFVLIFLQLAWLG